MLYARGVDLVRVEVVPDVPEDIAASARALSSRVGPNGFVFSSGGIGPTHDDVTYESIAAAFGVPLEVHAGTVENMRVHYEQQGKTLNEARLRMATLPAGCIVHDTPNLWVPLVQCHNVFILPGVPWLYKQMLEANRHLFAGPQLLTATLYTTMGEGDLAAALTAVAQEHGGVQIGSYPNTDRGDKRFATKLCFDSRDGEALQAAVQATRSAIPTCFDELPQ
jgi:molybdopterin-biosynthesis enzyme MoeA-like protein